MHYETKQPTHLKKPLYQLLIGVVLFAVGITALFFLIEILLPISGRWHPYVAALPGLGLSASLLIVYLYIRHYDELRKRLGMQALATSAIGGIVTLLVSVSRAAIGGYPELDSGFVMAVMAATFIVAAGFLSWRHR